jgi:hypothetical protein
MMTPRLGPAAVALALVFASVLASLLAAPAARADGAFPDSQSIMTPAALPSSIILATNFGVVSSVDGGATWLWSCEQDENSFATLYQVGAPPKNRLYARSAVGLIFSDDLSCSWSVAGGDVTGATVLDEFADPTNPNRILVVAAPATDGGAIYQILESSDGGATFGQLRYTAPAGDNITGVEIARATPSTVYISITSGASLTPKLGSSTDGGVTWQLHDLSSGLAAGTNSVRIVAVDPANANKVYLRVHSSAGDAVAIATMASNGTVTATTPLTFTAGILSAFTILSNGHVVVGGVQGVNNVAFRSTDGGATFQPLPTPPSLRALASRGTLVYAVADNVADGYAIGTSSDEGMTWQPIMRYDQIAAIDTCVMQLCQDDCLMRADTGQWDQSFCSATPPVGGAGGGNGGSGAGGSNGGSAGRGGTTGSAGTGAAAAGSTGAGAHAGTGGSSPPPKSSGCAVGAGAPPAGRALAACALLALAARRRRRARR